jgi:hypothetical protein
VTDAACFNRPFEVKRFQIIRHCNVDVARGLVLLFGIQLLNRDNELAGEWANFRSMIFQGFSKQWPTVNRPICFQALLKRVTNRSWLGKDRFPTATDLLRLAREPPELRAPNGSRPSRPYIEAAAPARCLGFLHPGHHGCGSGEPQPSGGNVNLIALNEALYLPTQIAVLLAKLDNLRIDALRLGLDVKLCRLGPGRLLGRLCRHGKLVPEKHIDAAAKELGLKAWQVRPDLYRPRK